MVFPVSEDRDQEFQLMSLSDKIVDAGFVAGTGPCYTSLSNNGVDTVLGGPLADHVPEVGRRARDVASTTTGILTERRQVLSLALEAQRKMGNTIRDE
ncbi:hypothetical protein VM1G_12023 [Cytospora mali]|uniref:Uncharacterized protein n=1 Tax=Cytospora mali TaxID=578113 RepID=A0A194VI46_CYTMA|nr:hypothetical protein VM1G_12023 [Valsa mali]